VPLDAAPLRYATAQRPEPQTLMASTEHPQCGVDVADAGASWSITPTTRSWVATDTAHSFLVDLNPDQVVATRW